MKKGEQKGKTPKSALRGEVQIELNSDSPSQEQTQDKFPTRSRGEQEQGDMATGAEPDRPCESELGCGIPVLRQWLDEEVWGHPGQRGHLLSLGALAPRDGDLCGLSRSPATGDHLLS